MAPTQRPEIINIFCVMVEKGSQTVGFYFCDSNMRHENRAKDIENGLWKLIRKNARES